MAKKLGRDLGSSGTHALSTTDKFIRTNAYNSEKSDCFEMLSTLYLVLYFILLYLIHFVRYNGKKIMYEGQIFKMKKFHF